MGISFIYAQTCPENIGFENASFSKWRTFSGNTSTLGSTNLVTVTEKPPVSGRITLNNSKVAKDFYGGFPVSSPNKSNYSVKLGDDGTGSQADRISYLFTVPSDKPTFNITYQYAVVFQDPNHPAHQQPRFTAKILDLSTNTYITCASFEYIATSSLPGFKVSKVNIGVLYKDWTAVNINLSGYQGKQVLLEFTAADCTQSGHFGYAYIDVNQNCEDIVQGGDFCEGTDQVTLKGPSGYNIYKWYNEDKSVLYGEGENIVIKPALPVGTKVVLDLLPFDGFGCPYSITTVIQKGYFDLSLVNLINACKDDIVDLTSAQYILNKSSELTYTAFSDPELQKPVDPTKITIGGKYYVKATAAYGCSSIKSVEVVFNEIIVDVVSEVKSCADAMVDLTSTRVQKNVPTGLIVSYFSDAAATTPLTNANNVTTSGDYFIKYQSQYCSIIKKVSVEIYPLPIVKITNPIPVCFPSSINITDPIYTAGSDKDITLTYYRDADLRQQLPNPNSINTRGNYYIKAVNTNGCSVIKSIFVEIYPLPVLQLKNPEPVCYPATIDLTDSKLYTGTTAGVTFTFYDINTGETLTNPKAVSKTGTYMVNIKNVNDCGVARKINVIVNPSPKLVINQPKKVFVGQAVNLTSISVIEGSKDYIKSYFWKDEMMSKPLTEPNKVLTPGIYYISLINSSGCVSIDKVNVINVPWPKIMVPTAFTPLNGTNNKLYPFFVGVKKLVSFKVINKWGNIVFETSSMDPAKGWDGYYKGSLQPFETYSWFAEGINELNQTYSTNGKTILIP